MKFRKSVNCQPVKLKQTRKYDNWTAKYMNVKTPPPPIQVINQSFGLQEINVWLKLQEWNSQFYKKY